MARRTFQPRLVGRLRSAGLRFAPGANGRADRIRRAAFFFFIAFSAGCGFERIQPPLPDAAAGLTLTQLEAIQNDDTLTDDEKREAIREAVGAADNDAGDRLVNFLFGLNVP